MSDLTPFVVEDLAAFCRLAEQNRIAVSWAVLSDIGPGWIGSRRELQFLVDGRQVHENAVISHLSHIVVNGIQIPSTNPDFVISGEGEFRKRGDSIELVYDWSMARPYENSAETGAGMFVLPLT